MKKYLSIFVFLTIAQTAIKSQDMHYSQAFNYPLLINPALAGNFDGQTRVIAAFRNQNLLVPNTAFSGVYNTLGASFETKMFPKAGNENTWTMGAMINNDYAGSGSLATLQALIVSSYNFALDRYGMSFLSIGGSLGITNRRIFSKDLLFESQVSGYNFDPNLPNLETYLNGNSETVFSANIGIMAQQQFGDNCLGNFGFSAFNINKPKEMFFFNSNQNVYSRFNAHGGLLFRVDDNSMIYPSLIYMKQGPASQVNAGVSYSYLLSDNVSLTGGVRSRIGDAFILIAGMRYKRFYPTISYDFTTSTLNQANNSVGALELNITFLLGEKTQSYSSDKMYCPSF